MPAIAIPGFADHVKALPSSGTARNRQLYRFIDFYAATEAAAALHNVALRLRDRGAVTRVLHAADVIVTAATDRGETPEDDASRDKLRDAIASPEFLAAVPEWVAELRGIASTQPETGACTVATALTLWLWTMKHLGAGQHQTVDDLADALCPLLAARCFALEVAADTAVDDNEKLRRDLCHVYSAHVSALAGTACAELVFGYRRHLVWDAEGCSACFAEDHLDELEGLMPGIAVGARMTDAGEIIGSDGSHVAKAGPCATFSGVDSFMRLRRRLDGCLTGARVAKEHAVSVIAKSLTPDGGLR